MLTVIVIFTRIVRKFYSTYFFGILINICLYICIYVHLINAFICIDIHIDIHRKTVAIFALISPLTHLTNSIDSFIYGSNLAYESPNNYINICIGMHPITSSHNICMDIPIDIHLKTASMCIDICINIYPITASPNIFINITINIHPTTESIYIDICINIHSITASHDIYVYIPRDSPQKCIKMHIYLHQYSSNSITWYLHQYSHWYSTNNCINLHKYLHKYSPDNSITQYLHQYSTIFTPKLHQYVSIFALILTQWHHHLIYALVFPYNFTRKIHQYVSVFALIFNRQQNHPISASISHDIHLKTASIIASILENIVAFLCKVSLFDKCNTC